MGEDTVKGCCTPARPGSPVAAVSPAVSAAVSPVAGPAVPAPSTSPSAAHEITWIPGGQAYLGTDNPQIMVDEEGPLRRAKIKPFQMDTTSVTNARFAAFVAATGYVSDAERLGDSFVFAGLLPDDAPEHNAVVGAEWWRMVRGACWHRPLGPYDMSAPVDDHPVTHVTWNDAQAFAAWAGGRLPSEAEWEHAARGGLGDVAFPWGDDAPDDDSFLPCNIWQGQFPTHNSMGDGYFGTAPARSFAPNGYGLFNMVGNVWEWTAQSFKVRSLKKQIKQAHSEKRGFKVIKGGSFLCHRSYCFRYRIAARTASSPDSSTSHTGFRVLYETA